MFLHYAFNIKLLLKLGLIKDVLTKSLLRIKVTFLIVLKILNCNSGNTEMFGKKITVLQGILQSKEAATQRCQKSCSEKFQKIPTSIVLIFAIKSTAPRMIIWEFSQTFQNSCFKEHLRTADYLGKPPCEQKHSTTDGFLRICEMFQNSCFKERFRMAASENIWESCRSLNKNADCSSSTLTGRAQSIR